METLQGKTVLVTGATSGIGKAAVLALAQAGALIFLAARTAERGAATRAEILATVPTAQLTVVAGDLGTLAGVHALADAVREKTRRLDVLINNAGLFSADRKLTPDGFEMTFAVNHLAPFLLTQRLLPLLHASPPARIVNVGSTAHSAALDFDNLQGEKDYGGLRAYTHSKRANLLFTLTLSQRLAGSGVVANCVHPGVIRSGLQRDLPAVFKVLRLFFASPQKGAARLLHVAGKADLAQVNGRFFESEDTVHLLINYVDEEEARRLWDLSEQMVGGKE